MTVQIKDYLRVVPNFPKPGIMFRDISPLLNDPVAYRYTIELMVKRVHGLRVEAIAAIESRGFLFGAPLAFAIGVPLTIARKPGKLPGETNSVQYGLEYGVDMLHMQKGAVASHASVLIVDDVLATGGTAEATKNLVTQAGGIVGGYLFLAEIDNLGGRKRLGSDKVESLVML